SGARLDYFATKKLEITLYVLNGYNMFQDNNEKKSFGGSILYSFTNDNNVGYTAYEGDDSTSGSHRLILNNIFLNYGYGKLKFQLGADYCIEQNADTTHKKTATMYSAIAAVKFQAAKQFDIY